MGHPSRLWCRHAGRQGRLHGCDMVPGEGLTLIRPPRVCLRLNKAQGGHSPACCDASSQPPLYLLSCAPCGIAPQDPPPWPAIIILHRVRHILLAYPVPPMHTPCLLCIPRAPWPAHICDQSSHPPPTSWPSRFVCEIHPIREGYKCLVGGPFGSNACLGCFSA